MHEEQGRPGTSIKKGGGQKREFLNRQNNCPELTEENITSPRWIGQRSNLRRSEPRIEIYKGRGVVLKSPTQSTGNPDIKNHKRGSIKTWSAASRRRMREFMVSHYEPDGYHELNVTLTIPGPKMETSAESRLFEDFLRLNVQRQGMCAVWRKEVQKRGSMHLHFLAYAPASEFGVDYWVMFMRSRWLNALNNLPEITIEKDTGLWTGKRGVMPGADQHAISIQTQENHKQGAWRRYLLDHTSKKKQEQVGENIGRHWGVVGKKRFEKRKPETQRIDERDFYKILRVAQKLTRPRIKDSESDFGHRKGFRTKRGKYGRSVWFDVEKCIERMSEQKEGNHE